MIGVGGSAGSGRCGGGTSGSGAGTGGTVGSDIAADDSMNRAGTRTRA